MPYGSKRSTYSKKKRAYKAPLSRRLRNAERKITALQDQAEFKFKDTYSNGPNWVSPGVIYCPHFITKGDDRNNRIADHITAKYLDICVKFTHVAAGSTVPTQYRLVIFWDTQTNGVGASPWTTLSAANVSLLDDSIISAKILSPRNDNTKNRYHILHDEVTTINPQSSSTDSWFMFEKRFWLGNANITYVGNLGDITDLSERSLQVLAFCSVATTAPIISQRFFYTDE